MLWCTCWSSYLSAEERALCPIKEETTNLPCGGGSSLVNKWWSSVISSSLQDMQTSKLLRLMIIFSFHVFWVVSWVVKQSLCTLSSIELAILTGLSHYQHLFLPNIVNESNIDALGRQRSLALACVQWWKCRFLSPTTSIVYHCIGCSFSMSHATMISCSID